MFDRVRQRPSGLPRRVRAAEVDHFGGRAVERGEQRALGPGASLAIIDAQYHRELARAATAGPAERVVALAEARRLVKVAATIGRRATDPLDGENTEVRADGGLRGESQASPVVVVSATDRA